MVNQVSTEAGIAIAPKRVSEWQRFRRVFFSRGLVVFGMVIIVIFILIAIFAPFLAPYDPYEPDLSSALQDPSSAHWLGTDALGRDTLSRIIYGTRTSLEIGLVVVAIATVVGLILGTLAGYYGGWTYIIIMRLIDALMAFPMMLLAMVIAAMLGGGMKNVIVALSVSLVPSYARLMCGQVLSVKQNDYVLASRVVGASNLRIMLRHVVINCMPPLIVLITMMLGSTILAEASLSFLGIGILTPEAAWGSMISEGREYLIKHPLLSVAPGVALMLVVFAFNMVGDGLRDALDPRLRGQL
jgi:peptide/nickel transport system permease protein